MSVRFGSQLRVLVAGAGIAGLAAAALLEQRGFTPTIVEKARGYGGVGYVLALWPAGINVIDSLGLHDALTSRSRIGTTYAAFDAAGRSLMEADFGRFIGRFGDPLLMERSTLIDVLRGALRTTVRFGESIARLEQTPNGIEATFESGARETYDVVVGADGLHSMVRQLVFGDVPLLYHGITGWAFWTPVRLGGEIHEYYGNGRFLGIYPGPTQVCAFSAAAAPRNAPDDPATRRARLLEIFDGFGGDAARSLEALTSGAEVWHDDFLDVRMKPWVKENVVLVGDAAHAIMPTAGVGASMALESACVLADELSRANTHTLARALAQYERRRRKRVDTVQGQSRWLALMVRAGKPFGSALRDGLLRRVPPKLFLGAFTPLLETDVG